MTLEAIAFKTEKDKMITKISNLNYEREKEKKLNLKYAKNIAELSIEIKELQKEKHESQKVIRQLNEKLKTKKHEEKN